MSYKKPQTGNPNQIKVNQHNCFSNSSIKKFLNIHNKVEVFIIQENKREFFESRSDIFCAKRQWDYETEDRFMKQIEDPYADLITKIISTNKRNFSEQEIKVITDMFILWHLRSQIEPIEGENLKIKNVEKLAWNPTHNEQEELEKSGITSTNADFTVDSHSITGAKFRLSYLRLRKNMPSINWVIWESSNFEFLVPDKPDFKHLCMPISPNLCLVKDDGTTKPTDEEIKRLNQKMKDDSFKYCFAKDLSKCGINF